MEYGKEFLTLDADYISKFDEVVVIGDVHGCSEEFEEALERIHNESPSKNSDKVLKILVGDLVNKGPDSMGVLKICVMKYPDTILSVRGNHDELASSINEKYRKGFSCLTKEDQEFAKFLPRIYTSYLKQLPYTISIPSLNCIIVHAGLRPDIEEPAKNTPPYMMCRMRNVILKEFKNTKRLYFECTTSLKEGEAWVNCWTGPEHVYFGHDATRGLQIENKLATGLDTGCVHGDRLSYVYIKGSRKGEIFSVKAKQIYYATSESDSSTCFYGSGFGKIFKCFI